MLLDDLGNALLSLVPAVIFANCSLSAFILFPSVNNISLDRNVYYKLYCQRIMLL